MHLANIRPICIHLCTFKYKHTTIRRRGERDFAGAICLWERGRQCVSLLRDSVYSVLQIPPSLWHLEGAAGPATLESHVCFQVPCWNLGRRTEFNLPVAVVHLVTLCRYTVLPGGWPEHITDPMWDRARTTLMSLCSTL